MEKQKEKFSSQFPACWSHYYPSETDGCFWLQHKDLANMSPALAIWILKQCHGYGFHFCVSGS